MSVSLTFTAPDGSSVETLGERGASLLDAAQAAGLPLEGTCEGQMACSTCHVVIAAECFAKLSPASEDEEDMLDLAYGVQPTSRLACQIVLSPDLDGLAAAVPGEARDIRGF